MTNIVKKKRRRRKSATKKTQTIDNHTQQTTDKMKQGQMRKASKINTKRTSVNMIPMYVQQKYLHPESMSN